MLQIDARVMKNLVLFMLENTLVNFDESFCESLSVENKSYLLKNYVVISKEGSHNNDVTSKENDLSEKDNFNFSDLAESKSVNSKSYVKIELSNDINS